MVSFRAVGGDGSAGFARLAVGVASGSGEVEVTELVRASEAEAAGAAPADDAAPLIEPWDTGGGDTAFDEPPVSTSPAVLGGVIAGLGAAFARARSAGNRLAGFATHGVETVYLGTTTGLRLRHAQPAGTMELVARSADGTRSVWSGAGTSSFDDIDIDAFEARLDRRLAWAQRTIELPAGRYEVLLPPDATADLMVAMSQSMSGRDAEEGRSPFSSPGGGTKVGESLSPLPFDLRGDPARTGPRVARLSSSPSASGTDVSVFDNGLAVGPTNWVEGGRLRRLQYHRAGAARSGVEPSPPVGNLILALPGATSSLDDMIADDRTGAAAHLPVVHPGGRPRDAAAHRAHPRRCLPRRARRGRRGREQLPLQREPDRRPRPHHRGGRAPSGRCRANGANG